MEKNKKNIGDREAKLVANLGLSALKVLLLWKEEKDLTNDEWELMDKLMSAINQMRLRKCH